jgi:hypothetical protein
MFFLLFSPRALDPIHFVDAPRGVQTRETGQTKTRFFQTVPRMFGCNFVPLKFYNFFMKTTFYWKLLCVSWRQLSIDGPAKLQAALAPSLACTFILSNSQTPSKPPKIIGGSSLGSDFRSEIVFVLGQGVIRWQISNRLVCKVPVFSLRHVGAWWGGGGREDISGGRALIILQKLSHTS